VASGRGGDAPDAPGARSRPGFGAVELRDGDECADAAHDPVLGLVREPPSLRPRRDGEHLSAWREYDRSGGQSGAVGVFHETYRVDPDDCETVYNNVPAYGLGGAGRLEPAEGTLETAGRRLGVVDDEPAVRRDGGVAEPTPDE
jgi:hypothetical protein